jgi:hypothetical protein
VDKPVDNFYEEKLDKPKTLCEPESQKSPDASLRSPVATSSGSSPVGVNPVRGSRGYSPEEKYENVYAR